MHPLDSLAQVHLAEQHQRIAADLRAADQRRSAASMAARLRSRVGLRPRPVVQPAPCGGTARHADPA